MAKLPSLAIKIDFAAIAADFQGLQGKHAGLWPLLPRALLLASVAVLVVSLGWFLYWSGLVDELDADRAQEETLKTQYVDRVRQAVALPVLRQQKEQVAIYVSQLEKQLPSKAEMDALLSDINQAGVGRGAQLMLFRPGQTAVREYYAELPIAVRVVGQYHDLGSFASDLANLARIVTLNNMSISPIDKSGALSMDAVAKTFRYLDTGEIAQQQAPAGGKK